MRGPVRAGSHEDATNSCPDLEHVTGSHLGYKRRVFPERPIHTPLQAVACPLDQIGDGKTGSRPQHGLHIPSAHELEPADEKVGTTDVVREVGD